MVFILLSILGCSIFIVVYAWAKFRLLMRGYKPTTLEKALQHVADLIAQRDKLEERIVELEKQMELDE